MTKEWWEFEGETKEKGESDFYKMKTGDNKVRILTQFERVDQLFVGEYPNSKPMGMVSESYVPKEGESVNTQGWAWAVIRETGEVKILPVSRGCLKLLAQLRASEGYEFDDFPMPYDVNIKNTGEGPNRYSVVAARSNTPVTKEELETLEKKPEISSIISKIKGKKDGKVTKVEPIDYPEEDTSEIPF